MNGWVELAAAVCERAVDDFRREYRRYLRSELPEERNGCIKRMNKIGKDMKGHLFWDITTTNISWEDAAKMVMKQEDEKWREEKGIQ